MRKENNFTVTVGNIGNLQKETREEAEQTFAEYVEQSKQETGRASGEDVFLFVDGEIEQEYFGTISQRENKPSIAETCLNYYEHRDFIGNYAEFLMEDKHAVQNRIQEAVKDYDFEKIYGTTLDLSNEDAEKVYEYILENIEEYTTTFNGYWVGSGSLDSISFGEQQEQLTGFTNEQGEEIKPADLVEEFEEAGFVVNGDSAYYDMSSQGVHVDLLGGKKIPLLKKLAEEKLSKQN